MHSPRLLSSMPKRSAAKKKQDDFEYDDPDPKEDADAFKDEAEEEKPKKRAKKKKEPVNEEPHVAVEGPKWMIHPPWLMYKSVKHSSRHPVLINQACDDRDVRIRYLGLSTCSFHHQPVTSEQSGPHAGRMTMDLHHLPRLLGLTWCVCLSLHLHGLLP